MSDLDNRITRLEVRADAQDEGIKTLRDNQVIFGKSLTAIENTLMQIKYAIYGGGLVFAAQAVGVKELLLKFIM
jgi:hypothetical protein